MPSGIVGPTKKYTIYGRTNNICTFSLFFNIFYTHSYLVLDLYIYIYIVIAPLVPVVYHNYFSLSIV
jgi:hypothetical protein